MMTKALLIALLFASPALSASVTVGTGGNGSVTSGTGGSGTITIAAGTVTGGGSSGWTYLGDVVDDNTKTGSDPYNAVVDGTVEVGNVIVCAYGGDNDGDGTDTNDVNGASDTANNEWNFLSENERDPGAASAGVVEVIFWSLVTTQIDPGDHISVNLNASRNSKALTCQEFSISGSTVSMVGTEQKEDSGTDPGALTVDSLANSEHNCFRSVATEMDATETTTVTSSWTATQTGTDGSTNTGNIRIFLEHLIATQTSFTSDPDASIDSADRASGMGCLDQGA